MHMTFFQLGAGIFLTHTQIKYGPDRSSTSVQRAQTARDITFLEIILGVIS